MAETRPIRLSLTESEALVLYRYLWNLEEEGKLDPQTPAFDTAIHRSLEIVYESLEEQLAPLWQHDAGVFDRAFGDVREQHRRFWEPRLAKPPKEPPRP